MKRALIVCSPSRVIERTRALLLTLIGSDLFVLDLIFELIRFASPALHCRLARQGAKLMHWFVHISVSYGVSAHKRQIA